MTVFAIVLILGLGTHVIEGLSRNFGLDAPELNRGMSSLSVSNLSPDVTEAMLYKQFSGAGPVVSVHLCRNPFNRRPLGYGYVTFMYSSDAERALNTMNFHELNGMSMKLMWSNGNSCSSAIQVATKPNLYMLPQRFG